MSCGLFSDSMAALFLFIVAITAAAFGSILYSYLYYRKKLRTGKGLDRVNLLSVGESQKIPCYELAQIVFS